MENRETCTEEIWTGLGAVTAPSGLLVLAMAGWVDAWATYGPPLSERARNAVAAGGGHLRDGLCEAMAVPAATDRPLRIRAATAPSVFDGEPVISLLEVELGLPWPDDRGEEPMPLGDLPVDRCGMAVGDAVALDSWSGHGAPSDDGLADLSYWGLHADAAHARFGGVELGPPGAGGPRGWFDLPVAEAERRAAALADWLSERPGGRGLVWSVDAHTDHHRVERAGRSHPLEAGLVEVAGCPVLGFGWDSGDHSMRHRGERAAGQVYPAALRRAGDGGTVLCWTIPPGEPEEQGEPG